MFYTLACPRRPIGTSLGLDWDENSYLGGHPVFECKCWLATRTPLGHARDKCLGF